MESESAVLVGNSAWIVGMRGKKRGRTLDKNMKKSEEIGLGMRVEIYGVPSCGRPGSA